MIVFDDITVREGSGSFQLIDDIMRKEGPPKWMLRTSATVHTSSVESDNLLHLWSDKRAVLMDTSHPLAWEVPDDDLRQLNEWCKNNGWGTLEIHRSLLEDPKGFEFWMRLYLAGLVASEELCEAEAKGMERMEEAYKKELEEEKEDERDIS